MDKWTKGMGSHGATFYPTQVSTPQLYLLAVKPSQYVTNHVG